MFGVPIEKFLKAIPNTHSDNAAIAAIKTGCLTLSKRLPATASLL